MNLKSLRAAITRPIRKLVTALQPRPKPADDQPSLLKWDQSWNPETARLTYEHAREVYRIVDAATDVIDRKVVAVFTVTSAIAVLAPILGQAALWSDRWWLSAGAVIMWGLAAFECWQAFKPQRYRTDPDVATIATPEWLALSPGAFYVERLASVRESIKQNVSIVTRRATALRGALTCALVEVGFLLAALLWR